MRFWAERDWTYLEANHSIFVVSDDDPSARHNYWTTDQVGIPGHQTDCFAAGRRRVSHMFLPKELATRIQKIFVIVFAD
jgi:hypothetical protein